MGKPHQQPPQLHLLRWELGKTHVKPTKDVIFVDCDLSVIPLPSKFICRLQAAERLSSCRPCQARSHDQKLNPSYSTQSGAFFDKGRRAKGPEVPSFAHFSLHSMQWPLPCHPPPLRASASLPAPAPRPPPGRASASWPLALAAAAWGGPRTRRRTEEWGAQRKQEEVATC